MVVDAANLITGGLLQVVEALTLGMVFETWKTRMGSERGESTAQAFRTIYNREGMKSFYKGGSAKAFESFTKGGILLFSKEAIINSSKSLGLSDVQAGILGGFGGGISQVIVMGPCTYLITASVAGSSASGGQMSTMQRMKMTFASSGIKGFYKGGAALMLRQGSNWASRQGLTDYTRKQIKQHTGVENLSIGQEMAAGALGGALSAWNQPFEVMRIDAQARAAKGQPSLNIVETGQMVAAEDGVSGLFRGILPRIGLCVWQTVFMVSVPYILLRKQEQ